MKQHYKGVYTLFAVVGAVRAKGRLDSVPQAWLSRHNAKVQRPLVKTDA